MCTKFISTYIIDNELRVVLKYMLSSLFDIDLIEVIDDRSWMY